MGSFWRMARTKHVEDLDVEDALEEIRRGAQKQMSSGTGVPTSATLGYIYIRLGDTPEIYGRETYSDDWTKIGNVS